MIINLQEIQEIEKWIKWHYRNTVVKIQAILNSVRQTAYFFSTNGLQWKRSYGSRGAKRKLEKCQPIPICGSYLILNLDKPTTNKHLWDNQGNLNIDWIDDEVKELLQYLRHNNGIVILFKESFQNYILKYVFEGYKIYASWNITWFSEHYI